MSNTVSVCRGCCCGTERKHPGVDHEGHLRLLRELLDVDRRAVRLRVTECLGWCGVGNLIVVQPSASARGRGARPAWFGFMLDTYCLSELAEWVLNGGPGVAEVPPTLALHIVRPAHQRGA